MRVLPFLFLFLGPVLTYKYVIFVPGVSNSQHQFCERVALVLANGGHDVTMVFINIFSDFKPDVKIPKGIKTYQLNTFMEGVTKEKLEKEQALTIFKETGLKDLPYMIKKFGQFANNFQNGCRIILQNKEFLKWLENEKFDVAYAHVYSSCSIGLIYNAKIPSWIWLNSGPLLDYVSETVGVPLIPSYVPPIAMESIDEMDFFLRIKSFVGHVVTSCLHRRIMSNGETQIFREELNDPNFPHTMDIAAKCPLIFVNSNELYDLPRPTLEKVINIGGLGVGFDNAKPLTGDFKKISETGKGLILFSFGSVISAHDMPLQWKNAILEAFASFPDYQFVMRYVDSDLNDRLPKNVHLFKWLPQKDLLLHNRTKAFITHGGYNSLQEAISAGVPLVTIALFGDQPKNAKIARKHGFAVNIQKNTLSKETVVKALKEILENDSYKQKVTRISTMVRSQPFKPAERLLKWSEFLAEFKNLDNLEPAGQKLNFIQYHSLDVIFFLFSVLITSFYIGYRTLKAFLRFLCRRIGNKVKSD